jgi:hypothetical protein
VRAEPLTEQGKAGNRTKSAVRARVEPVFAAQANDVGGTLVRSIGLIRARAKIGVKTLAYNMRLQHAPPCAAATHQPLPGVIRTVNLRPKRPKPARTGQNGR